MDGMVPLAMYSDVPGGMPLMAGGDMETTPGVGLDVVDRDLASVPALLDMRLVGDILAERCC